MTKPLMGSTSNHMYDRYVTVDRPGSMTSPLIWTDQNGGIDGDSASIVTFTTVELPW